MKIIKTKCGSEILVDDEDYEQLKVFQWGIERIYAMRSGKRSRFEASKVSMHRQIMGIGRGDCRCIDHIDGNGLNNQKSNLRFCDAAQNQWNQRLTKRNTSGFKGVSFQKQIGKWYARMKYRRRSLYLGTFDTPELAHEFRCLVADMLHGEFSNPGHTRKETGAA